MINCGELGCGYWGPNLLRNLVGNRNFCVVAVADLSAERRDFVTRLYPSIRVTDNPEELLNDRNIDAVVISTPAASHFDLTMRALHAGKHVLVEKPMATTVAEVEQISELANSKALIAMVGHTFIYNSAVRYVKKMIDSGDLGELRYIYSARLNLGRIRSDVDALWNLAPHDISIIQYWLDNPLPLSVSRSGVDYIQSGIEDVVFLNIHYPNKIMANVHVSWLDPRKVRCMTLVGSKKMVIYDDIAENQIAIYDKGIDRKAVLGDHMDYDKPFFPSFSYRSGDVLLPKIDFVEPLKAEIEHFADCVQNRVPCLTGPDHAKVVVKILSESSCDK